MCGLATAFTGHGQPIERVLPRPERRLAEGLLGQLRGLPAPEEPEDQQDDAPEDRDRQDQRGDDQANYSLERAVFQRGPPVPNCRTGGGE